MQVKLETDIDSILRCGMLPEESFNYGTKDRLNITAGQSGKKRPDKFFMLCDLGR